MAMRAPSLASSMATARPNPLLAAATTATLFFRPRSTLLPSQVSVRFIQPVLTRRTEDIHIQRVFNCNGGMHDVRWNVHDFAFLQKDFPAVDREFQRAFDDVRHLFVVVTVSRNDAPLL